MRGGHCSPGALGKCGEVFLQQDWPPVASMGPRPQVCLWGSPRPSQGELATTLLQGGWRGLDLVFRGRAARAAGEGLWAVGKAGGRRGGLSCPLSVPALLLCILALHLCVQDPLATAGELCPPRETGGCSGEWDEGSVVQWGLYSVGWSCTEEPFFSRF